MKFQFNIAISILIASVSLSAFSKNAWLSDNQAIHLRDVPASQYTPLETLYSGALLEVISETESSIYDKVKAPSGNIGWINKRFVLDEPVASVQLEKLKEDFELLQTEHNEYINVHKDTLKELEEKKALKKELTELKAKYNSLELLSKKELTLDSENSQLLKKKSMLESDLEKAQIELASYKASNTTRSWITGAALVCLGVVLSLILINLPKKNSRKDGWS
ncbi:TIGR04211 family SH3 domain-containing protein [Marinicellulosiphila megalodicopiae]|uniref:TIGR04211 family SH3 domain-containing protein n=1 Tax=Marinicellulosiphila megalodicopiae TaxID=2724896 RepID=UPI003BAEB130